MGNTPSTSPNPRTTCSQYYNQLKDCKSHLTPPLQLTDRYPLNATDVCEESEYALKKCLAFALSPKSAKVLYDKNAARKDRVSANDKVVPLLKPYLWNDG
ncbi:hypothetical protein TrVE_jg13468 [Triparma verrucosa]|uniref:Uncharacterized protein n=1 Tax=Triparma verrucosa TaxID=1606542 RepID=A0A9W7FD26_9STRA|nr:hypothetical protein TrVE_jg13468 [Triparma verrucosa]